MLTYWITNTGEVTSYCFMMSSSATAELSDNRKGFKDSVYFKKHVPATSRKKMLMENLWLVEKRQNCAKFPAGTRARRNQIAHLVYSPQADKHMCVSWHLVWKLLQCFLKEKKILKTWKRKHCIFCPCDEETSRFWVKMVYLVRNFI